MKTDWKTEWKSLAWMVALFLGCYALPLEWPRFQAGLAEGLALTRWYAREHVLLCLVPAFFIAGAIATFVRQESVMRYLGPQASKPLAYGVASVSGTILAVCSCTVLPLFAGIWRMGAGLGPAIAFLYSGPAISALAIILTARVLGLEIGLARAIGAILFSLVIGWLMAWAFRKEESAKVSAAAALPDPGPPDRPLWKTTVWIGLMVALLILANWNETEKENAFFARVAEWKWGTVSLAALGMAVVLVRWFDVALWKVGAAVAATVVAAWLFGGHMVPFSVGTIALAWISSTSEGELGDWFHASWDFAKMITPLLLGGVFVSGMLLGRPGHEALIPSDWIAASVGGNSLGAIFFSSVVGAFMYFATLTEIPILQGLMGSGMGKGPALALLLAGPALSLPSMIAIWKIMGGGRTLLYCGLVIVMATLTGWAYGYLF
jgi:uncharacterized membrane protein YraQ (UPF0718 family)